jgi:hypothetical protein
MPEYLAVLADGAHEAKRVSPPFDRWNQGPRSSRPVWFEPVGLDIATFLD